MTLKINVGCGDKCKEGFEGVDKVNYGQEHVLDVEDTGLYPILDESVDEIFSSHFLEHIRNIDYVMREFWRVLKKGGTAHIIVPYFRSEWAFRDPSHVRFFTENTFFYFNQEYAKKVNYHTLCDFDIIKIDVNGNEVEAWLKKR